VVAVSCVTFPAMPRLVHEHLKRSARHPLAPASAYGILMRKLKEICHVSPESHQRHFRSHHF